MSTATEADSGSGGALCGNAVVEEGEACDDGVNDGAYGGCNADCAALAPYCGDAITNGDEACDEGNQNLDGHGCNHDCIASGTMLWALQYDGAEVASDHAYGVDVDSSDNVGEAGEFAYTDVAVDPNDDIAAAGSGYAAGQGQGRMAQVRKYDAFDGATLWTDTLSDETLDQWAWGIAADDEGYFAEIGLIWPDILVRRVAPDGHEVWRRTVSGTGGGGYATSGSKVAIDEEGNIICVGQIVQPEGLRLWIRKYDANGVAMWTRIADDSGLAPHANDVALDSNGNPIFVASLGPGEMLLRKLDADGNELWTDDVVDVGIEMGYVQAVATDSADNVVITGTGGTDSADVAAVKYDGDGNVLWGQLLTNNGADNRGEAVATDSHDDIIVVGYVLDASPDMWIAKLAP